MQQISDKEFYPFIKKSRLVIVDFWAERCPTCVMLMPVLEQLEKNKKYKNKITFAKLDVDENHEVASKFSIMTIPTLLIFKDGKMIDQITDFQSAENIKKRINKYL